MEGSMEVAASPSETLRRLRDPAWLGKCLPNLASLELLGEREFKATFYLDIGELTKVAGYLSRIRADMRFRYEDEGGGGVRVLGTGRVVGAKIGLTIDVKVAQSEKGTQINWSADADLGVIQRLLGEATIRRVAHRQIELLTAKLKDALDSGIN
ncbi:hypothetical protein HRbin02_00062 [Candidatus Calditenuaceae archaeon HR02]|nr:hypothetical protein HRbin02_00062 [Candidatus Calditenuaceae archaeon HR02]